MDRLTRTALLPLALFLILAPLRGQEGPDGGTYEERQQKVNQKLAKEYCNLGNWLEGKKMYEWAREDYNRALAFDANNETAQKKLGNKYNAVENKWEFDAEVAKGQKVLTGKNEKGGEDAKRIRKEYEKKVETTGKGVAKDFVALGKFCRKGKDEEKAVSAFKRALEYDPTNSEARKELGYEKDKTSGMWLSKEAREFLKQLKEGLAKAPKGEESKEQTQVEKDMSLSHTKRRSDRVLIESATHKQEELADLIQHAEQSLTMFEKLFSKEGGAEGGLFSKEQPFTGILLRDKAQHEAYVDRYYQSDGRQKEFAKKSRGLGGNPRESYVKGEDAKEDLTMSSLEDWIVHGIIQVAAMHLSGEKSLWIHEGLAYWFTKNLKETAVWSCVDLSGTGSGSSGKNFQDAKNWQILIRTMVNEGEDPSIHEVVKCTNFAELSSEETVKGWSLVDFLVNEHREKFVEFCQALAQGAKAEGDPVEQALLSVFQWKIDELDAKWKLFVKSNY